MFQQQGDLKKSLEYYQHYFECARSEKENKNRRLIDKARVIVGIAKADQFMGNAQIFENMFLMFAVFLNR